MRTDPAYSTQSTSIPRLDGLPRSAAHCRQESTKLRSVAAWYLCYHCDATAPRVGGRLARTSLPSASSRVVSALDGRQPTGTSSTTFPTVHGQTCSRRSSKLRARHPMVPSSRPASAPFRGRKCPSPSGVTRRTTPPSTVPPSWRRFCRTASSHSPKVFTQSRTRSGSLSVTTPKRSSSTSSPAPVQPHTP